LKNREVPFLEESRGLVVLLTIVVVPLFLGNPMTEGEKIIATNATISNSPKNLPRLMESTETLALPRSLAFLKDLSPLRYTITRETKPSITTAPVMPSPDWMVMTNRTSNRMNQTNLDRNPKSILSSSGR